MISAMFFFRISRWFYIRKFRFIAAFFTLIIYVVYSSKISSKCRIGQGTFFVYGGLGLLINECAIIGEGCSIGVGVKIIGQGPYRRSPRLGNRIFIGPNAVIQGPVVIEDNVIIAPNCVVNKSVPEGAIVAGVPAKIVGWVKDLDYDIFKNEVFKDDIFPYLVDNRMTD
jgi:serine O-acetyltransferase